MVNLIATITNALRRPAKLPALAQTQTDVAPGEGGNRAQVGWLHRELATHPSRGLTPDKLYRILEGAEAGDLKSQHELFADMEEKDAQIGSDLGKRKQAACKLEWQIVPPDSPSRIEKKAAAMANELFLSLDVDDLILDLADGIGHGWVMLELPWATDGTLRTIEQPKWVPHGWFQLHSERQNEIRLRDGSMNGEELWPLGWLRHIHKAKSGYVSRIGLHRQLVWPYLFQNYALGDLAELLDILGIPARLGTYPHGSSEAEKETLLRAVTSLGRKAAGIIPDGMKIDYLSAADADGSSYEIMLNWCERAKSKVILGGTLTTGTDQGSGAYSLGEVHERGLLSLIESDIRQYAGTINRDLLFPLAALNFGITQRERAPRFYLDTGETEDFERLAKALPVFVSLGARISRAWLHEKTGIPEAEDGDETLAPVELTPTLTPQPGVKEEEQEPQPDQADAPLTARLAVAHDKPDYADRQAVRLEMQAGPLVDAMLSHIRRELDAAESMEALEARLTELYPDLASADLSALLGQAFLAAELAGRWEARA